MALTLCGRPSHAVHLEITSRVAVRNPGDITTSGLASSAFARHYSRNLGWCLFLALLRCFSSGGSPPIPILFSMGYLAVGFPIRKSPDHCSFAAPRSLSQLITSFIGSWCQGIPLALFLAWSSSKWWISLRQLHPFSSSNQNPLTLGFWFVKRTAFTDQRPHYFFKSHYIRKVQLVLYYSWIMQAHVLEDFSFSKNCIFTHFRFYTQNLWKMFLTVAFS